MLMPFPDLVDKYHMQIDGVLALGAHLAEEAPLYQALNEGNGARVWWVEANPFVLPKIQSVIRRYPNQALIHALVHEKDDVEHVFHITNHDGMSSSTLPFGTHTQFSPETVFVADVALAARTVDSLVAEHNIKANFISADLQGGELFAFKGAPRFIDEQVEYILCEVNRAEVYVGCAQVGQIDFFLSDFDRVETHWVSGQDWGDALYVRRNGRSMAGAP